MVAYPYPSAVAFPFGHEGIPSVEEERIRSVAFLVAVVVEDEWGNLEEGKKEEVRGILGVGFETVDILGSPEEVEPSQTLLDHHLEHRETAVVVVVQVRSRIFLDTHSRLSRRSAPAHVSLPELRAFSQPQFHVFPLYPLS